MGEFKMFGKKFTWEDEPVVVDKDGKPVGKASVGEKIFGAIKTVAKVGVATGVAFGAYKLGEARTTKSKNEEINEINRDRLQLWNDKAELEEKLQAALSPETVDEESETDEDDDEEVVTF